MELSFMRNTPRPEKPVNLKASIVTPFIPEIEIRLLLSAVISLLFVESLFSFLSSEPVKPPSIVRVLLRIIELFRCWFPATHISSPGSAAITAA